MSFIPLEWQRKFLEDKSPVVVVTGSAGGGKSRAVAEKIHMFAKMYPGVSILIGRKIREHCLDSCYEMMRREVCRDEDGKLDSVTFGAKTADYTNGSKIYFIGMKDRRAREAVRSIGPGKIDMIWMEEAHEFEEEDYEELEGRLRGATAGWNQLIISTNPDGPLHWINRRMILGKEAKILYSSESDNPYNDEGYSDRLEKMTGVKRARLRDGKWVQGTGTILETWSDEWDKESLSGNVTDNADYMPGVPDVWLFADQGYAGKYDSKAGMFTQNSHPRVLLYAQKRPDGSLSIIDEMYKVRVREDAHIQAFKNRLRRMGYPWPLQAIYDSASPSLGAALRDAGIRTTIPGTKNMDDSVDFFRSILAPDENNWRQFVVHPRCRIFRLEMASWTYNSNGGYNDYFDNGPDAARYGVYRLFGPDRKETSIGTSASVDEQRKINDLMSKIEEAWNTHMAGLGV